MLGLYKVLVKFPFKYGPKCSLRMSYFLKSLAKTQTFPMGSSVEK